MRRVGRVGGRLGGEHFRRRRIRGRMVQVTNLDRTIVIVTRSSHHYPWMILLPARSLCGSIHLAVVVAALAVNSHLPALPKDAEVANYFTRR